MIFRLRTVCLAAAAAVNLPAAARAQTPPGGAAQPESTPVSSEPPTAPVAPPPAPKPASATKISGKLYTDFGYRKNQDDGADKTNEESTGLDVKRFYVTIDHSFDDTWAARFRTDVGDLGKHVDVFVKHAYLQAKIAPELTLRAGAADLPWVPMVEDLYGFRWVENVLIDRTKFGTSADWGLHAVGSLGGVVSYALSVVNGRGYGDWTRSKSPTLEGRVSVTPVDGLTLAVGGLVGKLGQDVAGVDTQETAARGQALAAYARDALRVGIEGFYAKNDSPKIVVGGAMGAPPDSALGFSAWLSYFFVPEVGVFGRFDFEKPANDTNSDLQDLYFNAGLTWKPVKAVDLAALVKRDQVRSGTLSTTNGTIGSTATGESGSYLELGLFGQYSF